MPTPRAAAMRSGDGGGGDKDGGEREGRGAGGNAYHSSKPGIQINSALPAAFQAVILLYIYFIIEELLAFGEGSRIRL